MLDPEPRPRIPWSWRVLGWTFAALLVALGLLWFVWGFRWPPTAEVVDQPEVGLAAPPAPIALEDHGPTYR
jgi:hypothetical protein